MASWPLGLLAGKWGEQVTGFLFSQAAEWRFRVIFLVQMPLAMKTAALVATFFLAFGASALKLVPNPSFEEYHACPPNFGFIVNAVAWEFAPWGSPDLYNECHTGAAAGVPHNTCGYQYPATGQGYSGVITYDYWNQFAREFMSVELVEPLVLGVPVHLAFKMAVGGFGTWDGNSALYTSSGVGLKFTSHIPQDWISYLHPNSAALAMSELPTDTAIWYTVQGTYVSDCAYTHLMIGNFFADSLTQQVIIDSTGFANTYNAYAFIDDVCVAYDPAVCGIGQGLGGGHSHNTVRASSPFDTELRVWLAEAANEMLTVELLDAMGRVVWGTRLLPGSSSFGLSTPALTDGIYLLRLSGRSGTYPLLRVVHQTP